MKPIGLVSIQLLFFCGPLEKTAPGVCSGQKKTRREKKGFRSVYSYRELRLGLMGGGEDLCPGSVSRLCFGSPRKRIKRIKMRTVTFSGSVMSHTCQPLCGSSQCDSLCQDREGDSTPPAGAP